MYYADEFRHWMSRAVAKSVVAALAPSTMAQYAGSERIFLMFCMYVEGGDFALPVTDDLLCI